MLFRWVIAEIVGAGAEIKVFCFFSSEKKTLAYSSLSGW
jgi:hypothetical protein